MQLFLAARAECKGQRKRPCRSITSFIGRCPGFISSARFQRHATSARFFYLHGGPRSSWPAVSGKRMSAWVGAAFCPRPSTRVGFPSSTTGSRPARSFHRRRSTTASSGYRAFAPEARAFLGVAHRHLAGESAGGNLHARRSLQRIRKAGFADAGRGPCRSRRRRKWAGIHSPPSRRG